MYATIHVTSDAPINKATYCKRGANIAPSWNKRVNKYTIVFHSCRVPYDISEKYQIDITFRSDKALQESVPWSFFAIHISPSTLDKTKTVTTLVGYSKYQAKNCDECYSAASRFTPKWQESGHYLLCLQSRCLFHGDNRNNKVAFTLRDQFGKIRRGDYFTDHITLHVTQNDTQENSPKIFECVYSACISISATIRRKVGGDLIAKDNG